MSTPVSVEQIRYGYAAPDAARSVDRFAVWEWAAWIWGIVPWPVFMFFAQPIVEAMSRGKFIPMPPAMSVATGLYDALILIVLPSWALYAGWVRLVVVRVAGDRITIGRWFGAQTHAYDASDVASWRAGSLRWRAVAQGRRPWRLRIDFWDGSWVSMSRTACNFRQLEAWLAQKASTRFGPVALSSGKTASMHRFVVRDLRARLQGLTLWIGCWIMAAVFVDPFLSGRFLRATGPGEKVVHGLTFVMFVLGPLIGGPFCAHTALKDVRVDAPWIHVERWFGLSRRTYREDDIKTWYVALDPNPPWWREAREATLVLRFTDGAVIILMGRAANFDAFLGYIRNRAPAREDVRRSARRSGARS